MLNSYLTNVVNFKHKDTCMYICNPTTFAATSPFHLGVSTLCSLLNNYVSKADKYLTSDLHVLLRMHFWWIIIQLTGKESNIV